MICTLLIWRRGWGGRILRAVRTFILPFFYLHALGPCLPLEPLLLNKNAVEYDIFLNENLRYFSVNHLIAKRSFVVYPGLFNGK